jgi:hypothetical protein
VEDAVTRVLSIACACLLAGCSLIWKADRDAIAGDLDAGPDAGPRDAGFDAGPFDAGRIDAGCTPSQLQETQCSLGIDEDCDGTIDCFDFDCRGIAACCRPGTPDSICTDGPEWTAFPTGTTDIRYLTGGCAGISAFSTSGGPTRALIGNECQPVHFGMRYTMQFRITTQCTTPRCDYAALTFVNVRALAEGSELEDQFRIVVSANGTARVERAGTPIGNLGATLVTDQLATLVVDLEPGPDAEGRDVLFGTITIQQGGPSTTLLDHIALVPLARDVLCIGGAGGPEPGLFVALEGAGNTVHVVGDVDAIEQKCANPSQFAEQGNASTAALDDCAPLNIGAPALASYCYRDCAGGGSPLFQWDAWLDGSDRPREDDVFTLLDFGVCAYTASGALFPDGATRLWSGRSGRIADYQWNTPPSSRDPTILPYADLDATDAVQTLWYAYAQRTSGDVHAIHAGSVSRIASSVASSGGVLLAPSGDCRALRDPLLLADWEMGTTRPRVNGAWLLFTCEPTTIGEHDSILRVHLSSEMAVDDATMIPVLTAADGGGEYSEFGVSGPEGFTEVTDTGELTVRLWFTARDGAGVLRLGYAQGRSTELGTFPELQVYPANPILEASAPVLGGDCTAGCSFTGASVTPIANDSTSYQFLIARSRNTAAGQEHELIPLTQPRPQD